MPKKRKVSKLNDRDEEFLKGGALKQRKQAVDGKPDQSDIDNLVILFEEYDKAHNGGLKRFCEQLRLERELNSKFVMINADKADRVAFALPEDLQIFMEKYYPSIWTNPEHGRWFVRKFPMFRR